MLSFFRRVSNSKIGTWVVAAIGVAILGGFALADLSNFGTGNLGLGMSSGTLVKVGDQVAQGQPIGLEGSTGNSTGPHLHFELRIDNKPVDPTPYLPPGAPSDFRG